MYNYSLQIRDISLDSKTDASFRELYRTAVRLAKVGFRKKVKTRFTVWSDNGERLFSVYTRQTLRGYWICRQSGIGKYRGLTYITDDSTL